MIILVYQIDKSYKIILPQEPTVHCHLKINIIIIKNWNSKLLQNLYKSKNLITNNQIHQTINNRQQSKMATTNDIFNSINILRNTPDQLCTRMSRWNMACLLAIREKCPGKNEYIFPRDTDEFKGYWYTVHLIDTYNPILLKRLLLYLISMIDPIQKDESLVA